MSKKLVSFGADLTAVGLNSIITFLNEFLGTSNLFHISIIFRVSF
jgi:hypothetical protein